MSPEDALDLRCTGRLSVELPDGARREVDLAALTFDYLEAFEPSLVVIHFFEAALPGGGGARVRVDVIEEASGFSFATVELRGGARLLGVTDLAALCDGHAVELRQALPRG